MAVAGAEVRGAGARSRGGWAAVGDAVAADVGADSVVGVASGGVDNKRASTILRAVRVAARLEEAVGMSPAAAQARLEVVPGVGPWTSAEVVQRSHGAADAVTVGDLHLPGIVGFALAGTGTRMTRRCCRCWSRMRGSGIGRLG